MSVSSVKNNQYVYIGKAIARTASAQVQNPSATGYIADGEVVVLASDQSVYDSSADSFSSSPWVQVAQRSGNDILYSPRIYGQYVTAYNGKEYTAGQEQIYEIGYTGSAGAIDATSGLDYILNISYKHDTQMFSEQINRKAYFCPATTSAKTVVKTLTAQIMKDYVNNGAQVTAVGLNSGTAAAIGAVTLSVTNGSNVITYSGTATGVAAGSLIRIGVTGSGRGTAIPVYQVKEAHPTISNAFILESHYAGPTNTALPNADHGLIATEGASWGIRVKGKSLTYVRDFFKFMRVRFVLNLSGFGSTTINKRQEAALGYGDARLVAEEESFSKGFEGALNRMTVPLPTVSFDAVTTTSEVLDTTLGDSDEVPSTGYDCITLSFYNKNDQMTVAGPQMPTTIKIYTVDSASTDQLTTGNLSIQSALNDWTADTPGKFATLSMTEA